VSRNLIFVTVIGVALAYAGLLLPPEQAACQEITKEVRDRTLREVQSLSRSGDYEAALNKLEWLYAGLPRDEAVVVSLFDFLVGRGNYQRAREIMESYIESRPTYVGGMAKLAGLYFTMGDVDKAGQMLTRFIEAAHNRPWAYEVAAQAYLNAGMADEALAAVDEARRVHDNAFVLYEQAARAYVAVGRPGDAADEYLGAVEGGLLAGDAAARKLVNLAGEPGARQAVVAVLERAADEEVAGLVPLTALWEMSMADGDCARGLEEITRMAKRDKSLAGLLVSAAREFERNDCYEECAEAYGIAADLVGRGADAPGYLLARGNCLESSGDLEGALAAYDDLAERYSDSRWVFDACLAMARVLRAEGRCEEAVAEAEKAMKLRVADRNARKAVLIKGDCLTILERFDDAKQTYDLVRPDWDDPQAQTAYYNLGEIAFYQHDFEAALSYYNVTLNEYPGEPLANDAVERLLVIRGSRSGDGYAPELGIFADGALLERQGRIDEALRLFRTTGAAGPREVRIQSQRNVIRLYMAAGEYDKALEACLGAADGEDSHWSPVALETAGDIYVQLGMLDEAESTYEDVIVKYPESVSAGEARRKLDVVRRGPSD
jgi:tetratricopeptide (TPR) repeat protein